MPENCTHDCSTCGADCSSRDLRVPGNSMSSIKKVIAVISGKGGVGKSTVTASLAVAMARQGKKVAILDADVTGPSIPMAFNIHEHATGTDQGINPSVTPGGIRIMSVNLLMPSETDPVLWRGPVIAGVITQFWTDVIWGDIDYMFVDMPPGTGDVPLTVFQSLPVDAAVVVTSPQDLVSMIVTKAVNMAAMMDIPVAGIVENYSWFQCPDCGKRHSVFGESRLQKLAEELDVPILARLPIDPKVAELFDSGAMEKVDTAALADAVAVLEM